MCQHMTLRKGNGEPNEPYYSHWHEGVVEETSGEELGTVGLVPPLVSIFTI